MHSGLLPPITPPTSPFQQIGMDLLGPFPPSTQRNLWIIVGTNCLKRYVETKALQSRIAVKVSKLFIEFIVLRNGAHKVLITDLGLLFMAQLMREILLLSHQPLSHHGMQSQTNVLTERLNKTVADMDFMYVGV